MRLSIYRDGGFVVTVPRFVGASTAEKFILTKAKWVTDKFDYFKKFTGIHFAPASKKEYALHKEKARVLAASRLAHFNQFYNFKIGKLSIRNQKTRWGSCAKNGNISFNYKIALIPAHMADYIIVHELCHISEFNHSRKFWSLVAQTIPNHTTIRKELKGGVL